jgi:hypothetical protein
VLVGPSSNNKIQVTSSAAATVWIAGSAIVISTASPPVVDGTNTKQLIYASIGAATQDVLTGAASQIARLMELSIRNAHATTATDITVKRTDNTNTPEVIKCTLLAGEELVYNGAGSWLHYDTNGALYPSVGNAATQAEMEAGTATNKYVTPQSFNWHPGACKCWGKATGAGTALTVNFNTSSITDTGTGQLTVNIGTDFSSADYSAVTSLERVTTSLSAVNVDHGGLFRNGSMAAGSFQIENYDSTATTNVAQDPANYFWAAYGDQ